MICVETSVYSWGKLTRDKEERGWCWCQGGRLVLGYPQEWTVTPQGSLPTPRGTVTPQGSLLTPRGTVTPQGLLPTPRGTAVTPQGSLLTQRDCDPKGLVADPQRWCMYSLSPTGWWRQLCGCCCYYGAG